MRLLGFVTHEAIIAIGVAMLWLGISLPLYARAVRHLSRDAALPWQGNVLAFVLSAAVPPAAVFLMMLAERLIASVWTKLRGK